MVDPATVLASNSVVLTLLSSLNSLIIQYNYLLDIDHIKILTLNFTTITKRPFKDLDITYNIKLFCLDYLIFKCVFVLQRMSICFVITVNQDEQSAV